MYSDPALKDRATETQKPERTDTEPGSGKAEKTMQPTDKSLSFAPPISLSGANPSGRRAELAYQAMTLGAILLVLVSIWPF